MSCFAEAMRLDLRRNALWMALAALLIFLLAPLAGMFAQMTARQTARAVEAASALAALVSAGLPVAEFAAATGLLEHTFLDLEGGRA